MKLELPGQFKGPECRRLIPSLRLLRSRLEPWFESLQSDGISKIAIVLRADGSLGSFGPSGIENVDASENVVSCDLVVADHGWGELADERIFDILSEPVLDAIAECMTTVGIETPIETLRSLANGG